MPQFESAIDHLKSLDHTVTHSGKEISSPNLFYTHDNGQLWLGDAVEWLKSLPSESIDLVFADPPYNLKKAEWDSFESQKLYLEWSLQWIEQVARILKPTGTFYICGFSEILADLKLPASQFFQGCRWLIWHYKNKANLSNDWGRSHESILHFRKSRKFTLSIENIRTRYGEHTLKYPDHPQAETSQYGKGKKVTKLWQPHPKGAKPRDVIEVPTTCNGMNEKTPHPTQKPEELVRKFVLASSQKGDRILDPFLGSGTTAVVAEQLGRNWLGCDRHAEYLSWAIPRIESAKKQSDEAWFWEDRNREERRSKNRETS
ncbi:site-specific DNA-methyltransferase [Leptolyngbya boryana CZ1]|uniref:Methyltransferase n=1 Tax=Leptolyngbya boryana CZ1 TaxID=3060204 RepID=A0AA96WV54_LEPBY|nr:site-specific DNA-methyltransferase [Leptolyngbya boryana]WNZ46082.1 site-specific DNA-methyltransferase [Leptolyngbya boryana CZ1]